MDMSKILKGLSLTKPAYTAAQQQAYKLHVMDSQETGRPPLPFARWLAAQTNALAEPAPQQAAPQNLLSEPAPFRF